MYFVANMSQNFAVSVGLGVPAVLIVLIMIYNVLKSIDSKLK